MSPPRSTQPKVRSIVRKIMMDFARRTGLQGQAPPSQRYLWTDAYAVCTFLELYRTNGSRESIELALRLVEHVHATLGRHHAQDPRSGWISGANETEGQEHPTRGGLRIGKRLPERAKGEPFDERLEWDRDGQYFHYLTKWMVALSRVGTLRSSGQHLRWAIELAHAAHAGFTYTPPGAVQERIVWKMSTDLSRPLVPSMGAHDALDGLLTLRGLENDARRAGWIDSEIALGDAIYSLRTMCSESRWATSDPLSLGGLLCDALRLVELSCLDAADASLIPEILDCAKAGLVQFSRSDLLERPAPERLAFRELGLAIGLHALPRLARIVGEGEGERRHLRPSVDALMAYAPMARNIQSFWLEPRNQGAESWRAHIDINTVMLATSLMPGGVLGPLE